MRDVNHVLVYIFRLLIVFLEKYSQSIIATFIYRKVLNVNRIPMKIMTDPEG